MPISQSGFVNGVVSQYNYTNDYFRTNSYYSFYSSYTIISKRREKQKFLIEIRKINIIPQFNSTPIFKCLYQMLSVVCINVCMSVCKTILMNCRVIKFIIKTSCRKSLNMFLRFLCYIILIPGFWREESISSFFSYFLRIMLGNSRILQSHF